MTHKEAFCCFLYFPRERGATHRMKEWKTEEPQGNNGVIASSGKVLDVLRTRCHYLKTEQTHQ